VSHSSSQFCLVHSHCHRNTEICTSEHITCVSPHDWKWGTLLYKHEHVIFQNVPDDLSILSDQKISTAPSTVTPGSNEHWSHCQACSTIGCSIQSSLPTTVVSYSGKKSRKAVTGVNCVHMGSRLYPQSTDISYGRMDNIRFPKAWDLDQILYWLLLTLLLSFTTTAAASNSHFFTRHCSISHSLKIVPFQQFLYCPKSVP
jgi:hypothetical protein